jgi:hypothetical protein
MFCLINCDILYASSPYRKFSVTKAECLKSTHLITVLEDRKGLFFLFRNNLSGGSKPYFGRWKNKSKCKGKFYYAHYSTTFIQLILNNKKCK